MPILFERLPELHAPLLVFGFLGTLISLERAVALRATWPYAAPVLIAAGAILTLTPLPVGVGKLTVMVGLGIHLLQYRAIWRRQPMTATAVQALGAGGAVAAALAWSGGVPPSRLVPLFAAFLVLTIAGERLELARLRSPGLKAERMLFALALAFALAAVMSLTMPTFAVPIAGLVLVLMVSWLLRYDIARTSVQQTGLPRFVAACLLTGYAWLTVAGVGWMLGGAHTEGPLYDATTHAVFLGFVITMVMAHAPIILPAVLGVQIPYKPVLYVPVALLQLALLVRVVGGDAWGSTEALRVGGAGAAVAMLAFAATVVTLSMRARRASAERSPDHVAA